VANELVTMILNEDVRSRTEYASETTRFLAKEVKRLESQLSTNDAKISAFNQARINSLTDSNQLDSAKELTTLRAQLLLLSATYSSAHPDILALKRKIKALERAGVKAGAQISQTTTDGSTTTKPLGLDALLTQRESLKEELNKATQKLSAARLGESLERGQHSERLEVIEQPTLPRKPVSPNRPKIFAVVFAMAIMAGAGLVIGAEKLDQSIYRRADLASLIDSHLIVSIPYIATTAETRHKKIRNITIIASFLIVILAAVTAVYFLLPNADIYLYKLMANG
jgi:capsule polysaccharide export protein KpsE/RkpR